MPSPSPARPRYANPIMDADVPDPDVIRLPDGGYALVASSFDRAPGLPLWRSDDLLTWQRTTSAGGYRPGAPHDGGVWAPSIRAHGDRLFIVWGDPDLGIFVVDAPALEGPWSEPRLILSGRGLIDACPIWDADGRAFVVHGYARSRAGFANRIDVFEADADLTRATSDSTVVIDGDDIDGCHVLEGPKIYRRAGELWIFAPAGGVATGWQYAFRALDWSGPWDHRIILAQGGTAVNGPHQGAWVTGSDGEEWFLHFQAKGHLGRVLHLQPLRWQDDGWPQVGDPGAVGEPVASAGLPAGADPAALADPTGDDFAAEQLGPWWHSRPAFPGDIVAAVGAGRLTLSAGDSALLRPLDGGCTVIDVPVATGGSATAALVLADEIERELRWTPGTTPDATGILSLTNGDGSVRTIGPADAPVRLGLRLDGDRAWFTVDGTDVDGPVSLRGRRWTGTEWGLAARGAGTAVFGPVSTR